VTRPHQYVQCDVPDGMTLAEYRASKRAPGTKPRRAGLVARLRARRVREAAAAAAASQREAA
jgi:hypothetical protein